MFLVALCLSIFLEAIQRLVEPQEVKNPKLVCIVGCFGLLSNILGLVLFHDHSHGHGPSHGRDADLHIAEAGYHSVQIVEPPANGLGNGPNNHKNSLSLSRSQPRNVNGDATAPDPGSPTLWRNRRFSGSTSRRLGSIDNFPSHPIVIRQEFINASRAEEDSIDSDVDSPENNRNESLVSETTSLLAGAHRKAHYTGDPTGTTLKQHDSQTDVHEYHHHTQSRSSDYKGHSHGHGDLNMRGVFLHVVGDALGNIGVIASALFIWLTDYNWRFYVDPGISLVITVIILASAIPLCKAASRILLQAMPADMSIESIREDIERLPGVLSTHHLHVWQLSDTKLVASLHIKVDCQIKDEGSERYMHLAKQVRSCLHDYGIHSSTIQPEFAAESEIAESQSSAPGQPGSANGRTNSSVPSRAASVWEQPGACLLACGDDCPQQGQCCPK